MARFVFSPWFVRVLLSTLFVTMAAPFDLYAQRSSENVTRTDVVTAPLSDLPVVNVAVDGAAVQGALENWRHSIGQGGVNLEPLPDRVVQATAKLRPRLIRVFIQEFFAIYPEHGRFDWTRLDPYMEALDRTGAKVVAAITIKPKPLYSKVDQRIWRPNDIREWQRVITELVKRYSVEKKIVTYWEIGNETDIGENGGCPFLITSARDYLDWYKMTIEPILAAFPSAKVGGPAVANAEGELPLEFIEASAAEQVPLHFISWHAYSDSPEHQANLVKKYRKLLDRNFPAHRPEMLITEWNKNFDSVSVEEIAFQPRRAAATAAILLAITDAGVDYSFYYHLWDQVCDVDSFRPFFSDPGIMYRHWNEIPHRFGLFGVSQEVRPQYFVYQLLSTMGGQRVQAASDQKDIRVLATSDNETIKLLLVNYGSPSSHDRVASIHFSGLHPGRKKLSTYRIDGGRAWSEKQTEATAREQRAVDVTADFSCQVLSPADSVCLVTLDAIK